MTIAQVSKRKFLPAITVVFLLLGSILGFVLHKFAPQLYFDYYPVIPLTYFVMGVGLVVALNRSKTTSSQKLITLYMILRGLKLLITFLLGLLYVVFVNDNDRAFLLILALFFFLYLIIETWVFYRYEKVLRRKFKKL